MKEKPILFSGAMVRAILDGTKTLTRRVVKPQPFNHEHVGMVNADYCGAPEKWLISGDVWRQSEFGGQHEWFCPYGQPGDRLWVKETFMPDPYVSSNFIYRATEKEPDRYSGHHWKPSIFCTRKASRINLEIVAIRVERLCDISISDAKAEGCNAPDPDGYNHAGFQYKKLWQSINGPGSWSMNPWVWVIEFKPIK